MKVYVIKPSPTYKKLYSQMCRAFGYEFKEIQNIGQVTERENLIIFHPYFVDNPDWVKVERFDELEYLENAVYIFGEDSNNGDVLREIEEWSGDIKDKFRFVMIPMRTGFLTSKEHIRTGGGVTLYAVSACAIALYERFNKRNKV